METKLLLMSAQLEVTLSGRNMHDVQIPHMDKPVDSSHCSPLVDVDEEAQLEMFIYWRYQHLGIAYIHSKDLATPQREYIWPFFSFGKGGYDCISYYFG